MTFVPQLLIGWKYVVDEIIKILPSIMTDVIIKILPLLTDVIITILPSMADVH
jgi:hypothetical protein